MQKKFKDDIAKNKILFSVLFILSIVFFIVFAYCSPYSGDDWAWGSQEGLERLASFFQGYNGRYAGNLLIMLLSRSKAADIIIKAIFFASVCILPLGWVKKKRISVFLLSFLLVVFMPTQLLCQSFIWSAGFANYVPSAVIFILLINILSDPFFGKEPKTSPLFYICLCLLAFIGSLFIENLTVCLVLSAVLFLIASKIKFKKVKAPYVCFFISSCAGAAFMFLNSAYLSILKGNDGYRSVGGFIKDIVITCIQHLKEMIDLIILDRPVITAAITVLLLTICARALKRTGINIFIAAIHALSCALIVAYSIAQAAGVLPQNKLIALISVCIAGIWALSTLILVFKTAAKNSAIKKFLLLLASAVIVSAPLLPVNPFGPRCMFCTYAILICLCGVLLDEALSFYDGKKLFSAIACAALVLICAAGALRLGIIMSDIHTVYAQRTDFAKKQSDNGSEIIYICELPYENYIWMDVPENELYTERFKKYYSLNENTELKIIDYDELLEKMKNFG